MSNPLMPKATALWLVENTILTFEQIAKFCNLHVLEVKTIADGESYCPAVPFDPIVHNQLTMEEIKRCEQDKNSALNATQLEENISKRKKERKYTPIAKRSERPDAIAWLLKNTPILTDKQIINLLSTTAKTVESIKNKTHNNFANIKPRCPVILGICKQSEIDMAVELAKIRQTSNK